MNLLKLKDFTQEIDKLVDILNRKFCIIPKLGIELEFYLRDRNNKLVTAAEIKRFKEKLEESNIILTEEKGADQFETQINHTSNILKLLSKINTTKSCLVLVAEKLNLKVLFNPKPFKNDYGSSMHFHLSLHDQKERNIFSEESINTNELLNSVISAILLMLNPSLYFFCEDMLEEYDRFTPNFMAPVNVSWGGNNRTTAIRIPESNIYNRRIEFRVPSALWDPQKIIFFLLLASIDGIKHTRYPIGRTYGNAADTQYQLIKLHNTPSSAKEDYILDEICDKILNKVL